MIYFTADLHLRHNNIVNLCNRPWKPEENNEMVIQSLNSVLDAGDVLYVIGDFCFSDSFAVWQEYCRRINGTIILLPGNHDYLYIKRKESLAAYEWTLVREPGKFAYFVDEGNALHEVVIDNIYFVLFHYPLLTWNRIHRGAVHLFGHEHGNMDNVVKGNCIDVGFDCKRWGHKPVSMKQIKDWLRDERGYFQKQGGR